ncbi:MAG: hypothetical protein O3A10_00295 [Chloroflexi bacterium]|nr:hypothetical protein [Chloroflexota bacterium]MDA1145396.1 hypothetical protein [Chloroflexota bacterium]
MLASLGRWSFKNPWLVLASWVVVLVAVFGSVATFGTAFSSAFEIPDSESRRGFDVLDSNFGGFGSGQTGSIVFRTDPDLEGGVANPEVRAAMERLFADAAA